MQLVRRFERATNVDVVDVGVGDVDSKVFFKMALFIIARNVGDVA